MEVVYFLLVSLVALSSANGCGDNSSNCSKWKAAGYCDPKSTYFGYMKDECKKTCGLCMPEPECTDEYDTCIAWKKSGYCAPTSSFLPFMKENCQRACAFCTPQPTMLPPATVATVATTQPPPVTAPPVTGPATVPTSLPEDCKDKSDYCSSYRNYCKHKDYIDYLKVECKRTCHYCWVTTKAPPTTLYVSTQPYTGAGGRAIQPNCGNKDKHKTRIVGGKNALPGSWPWQVSMDWIDNEANPGHMCGGTLITDEWVITAAHCFINDKNKDNYWLTLGQHNIKKKSGVEQVFNISQLILHPKYDGKTQDYDLALMKLKGRAQLNEVVRTACLPGQNTTFSPGTKCYITGWGLLKEYGEGPAILQQAQVPLVTRDECKKAYEPLDYHLSPRMICAGYKEGKIDSCSGDSGGPLVCNEKDGQGKDIWYLWGAISWGVGCARKGMYGVLSSTKVLRPWIDGIVFNMQ